MSIAACPICRKPVVAEYRPFCCRRCADIDLQRWLTGRYVLDVSDEVDNEASVVPNERDDP